MSDSKPNKIKELDLKDLKDRYSALKIKYDRFEKLWNNPYLETKGELLWYYNELQYGTTKMSRILQPLTLSSSDELLNGSRLRAITKCHRLIIRIKTLIESDEVRKKLETFDIIRPSLTEIKVINPTVSIKANGSRSMDHMHECSEAILLIESKNKVGYDIEEDSTDRMNRRGHRWDNSIKGKFLRGLDWIKQNPKKTAIIVVTSLGVIILLVLIL